MAKKSKKIKVRKGRDFRSNKNTDGLRRSKPTGYRFRGEHNYDKPTEKQIQEMLDGKRDDIYFENRLERSDKRPFSKRGNRFDKGGKITPDWGNDGSTPSNNKDYNDLYAMFPDNHKGAKQIWNQLSEKQKEGFLYDLDVTDAASEHIKDSWLEFINAKSEKDWLKNATNWDEMKNGGGVGFTKDDLRNHLQDLNEDEYKYSKGGGVEDTFSLSTMEFKDGKFIETIIGTDWTPKEFKEYYLKKNYRMVSDDSLVGFYFAKKNGNTFQLVPSFHKVGDVITEQPVKFNDGGELTDNNYFQVVNHFVYFCLNYPNNFFDAFGEKDNYIRKHIEDKFDYGYKKHGSYGAMIYFWTELDGKNKEKLANFIKENYKGKTLNYEGDTTGIIDHFVYFTQNYPNNFMDAFDSEGKNIKEHIQSKFNSYYEKYGSYAVIIKFWVELDTENQKLFASWIKENYTGHSLKFTTGGKVGGRGFFGLEKGNKITDINELKVGDIILGHSKQFNADNTFKIVDRRQYGTSVNFDAVYWNPKENKRIGNEDIGISQLNLNWEDFYLPKGKKYEGGGELSKEEIILSKLNSNDEISCEELEQIIERSPNYPVCHVGGMKLRKQFLRGCYKKI